MQEQKIPGYPKEVILECKKCGRRAKAVVKYPIAAWMCGKCTGALS